MIFKLSLKVFVTVLKELKLKMLIIDNFISPSDKEKLMSRAAYDDETDLWILQPNAKGSIFSKSFSKY